jgi:putative oxidoreductase
MQSLEKLKPIALLLLRWALAVVFILHGYPKLLGHTEQMLQAFPKMGFPAYFVYISGVIELFGGCLLVVGLFTRVAALLIAGEMAAALWKVHLAAGIGALNQSANQFPLVLCAAAFTLVALGGGAVSLDYALFKGKA